MSDTVKSLFFFTIQFIYSNGATSLLSVNPSFTAKNRNDKDMIVSRDYNHILNSLRSTPKASATLPT
jgi:hypothetical protein